MSSWDTKWQESMWLNNTKLIKIMDYIRSMLKALKPGWRWHEGALCHTKTWETEDLRDGKSPTLRTANVLVDSMNDVYDFLRFDSRRLSGWKTSQPGYKHLGGENDDLI